MLRRIDSYESARNSYLWNANSSPKESKGLSTKPAKSRSPEELIGPDFICPISGISNQKPEKPYGPGSARLESPVRANRRRGDRG